MKDEILMAIATKKFKEVSFVESGKRYKHGECIKVLQCENSPYVVFKFKHGNEFVLRKTVENWI